MNYKTIFYFKIILFFFITNNLFTKDLTKNEYEVQLKFCNNFLDSINFEIINTIQTNINYKKQIDDISLQINLIWQQILASVSSSNADTIAIIRKTLTDMSKTLDSFHAVSINELYQNRSTIEELYQKFVEYKSTKISALTEIQILLHTNEEKLTFLRIRLSEIESKLKLEPPSKF